MLCITNNPSVFNDEQKNCNGVFVEGDFVQVLKKVRDEVYLGHKLLSYPLGASIRMMYSPFRTIIIESERKELDEYSVSVIEGAISQYEKTMGSRLPDQKNSSDYEKMDRELFLTALNELKLLNSN